MELLVYRLVYKLLIIVFCVLCISVRNENRDSFCKNNCKLPKNNVPSSFTEISLQNLFKYELGTDSKFIFIFKEDTPLLYFISDCAYGMSGSGFIHTRLVALLAYSCIVFVEHTLYYFSSQYFLCCLTCRKRWLTRKKARRIRMHLVTLKRSFKLRVSVIPIFMLLLLCGDVHPNPGPVLAQRCRHLGAQLLNVASWNVRTLLETKRSAARPTAIVARELDRYNIDIAALSETRILGETVIQETGGGYTFFLKGKPDGDKHHHGVGFAIRTKLVPLLQGKYPVGINERLMTMSLSLEEYTLNLISAYAPTLPSSDESKESFYGALNDAIQGIPSSQKLLVMGDFNARVGKDYSSWENVLGRHGVGRENSNGTLLLSLCSQNELIITNTIYQQATRHKTTWMHPRSKEWHMIDYVITRQRDVKDVHHTRAMCGSSTWSDHRLVRSKLALRAKPSRQLHRLKPAKKPDIGKLKSMGTRANLAMKLHDAYLASDWLDLDATANWDNFKNITLKITEEVLGFPERKHRDWFDENDALIKPLLTKLHDLHVKYIEDKSDATKADAYRNCKQQAQKSLRAMQNAWWKARATELQAAADVRDYKTFYQGLKAVYGPSYKVSAAIKSKEGVLLTEPAQILDRWAEHFKGVLNQDSEFDLTVLQDIPQWDTKQSLDALPTLEEVLKSIKQLTCGKAAGEDGIPPDVYKHGGTAIAERLLKLFKQIWKEGAVPQEFRDATITHLYKNKGERSSCDNHRGISLLCIAGKILARLLLNRLILYIDEIGLVPESQCGFRPGRGTTDMLFSLRQIQEKCRLNNQDLYLLFIDLTKAFDTVNREALWLILERIGCPKTFVSLIRSFHDDMKATVREGSDKSATFGVTSGTKQGCVLAPVLFSIFFSLMLHVAFKDTTDGVDIKSRFDSGLCSTKSSHFNAPTKVTLSTIRDLLFADDCALAASSLEALQRLSDNFAAAARKFGLTISIKKTESLYQPACGNVDVPPVVCIEGKQLNAVEDFKYLGGIVSNDASIDKEINARIAKATSAFGRLTKRLWTNKGIRLDTKISVYKAAVITSLLYGCETLTLSMKQLKCLEKFHQTTLRKIAGIRWFHKVTNYEVLARCNIRSLQSMIESAKLRWTGHVVRMRDDRIPKALLYGRLTAGVPSRGNHNTYLNSVKRTLRACGIDITLLEHYASERDPWRDRYKDGIAKAESNRTKRLVDKRNKRKARADLAQLRT